MEDKLRNLSQNIANNTGPREAEEPETRDDDRISDEELRDTSSDDGNERIDADYEEQPADEPQAEPEEPEEYHDDNTFDGEVPVDDGAEEVAVDFKPVDEQEEFSDQTPERQIEVNEEPTETEPETRPEETEPAKAAILTMEEEHPEPEHTTKYSPEVEAALSRISSEDSSVDIPEPLSTEPHKKHHDVGRVFLFILFVLALAIGIICILVEQKIIDNPFPNLFKKETSEVQPPEEHIRPVELEITEWGIKLIKPEGVSGFWYEAVADKPNELRVFGTDENYYANETAENEGANAVLSLIRSTDSTLAYSDTLTLSPITSISGYYYYLTFISGDLEDEIVQLFTEKLLNNSQSILAL